MKVIALVTLFAAVAVAVPIQSAQEQQSALLSADANAQPDVASQERSKRFIFKFIGVGYPAYGGYHPIAYTKIIRPITVTKYISTGAYPVAAPITAVAAAPVAYAAPAAVEVAAAPVTPVVQKVFQ